MVTNNKKKVIDIDNEDDEMVSYFLGIDILVKMASRKTSVKEKSFHFGIPRSRSLLNTKERFLKGKYKDGFILNIVKRLFHVNLFLQFPMQKGGHDIRFMYFPII